MPRRTDSAPLNEVDALQGQIAGDARLTLRVGQPQNADPEGIRDAVQRWLQRERRRLEGRCVAGVRLTLSRRLR